MRQQITAAISRAVRELYGQDITVELSRPSPEFGDFSTNAALKLAVILHKDPKNIAEELRAALVQDLAGEVAAVEVAGAGFINLKLNDSSLLKPADRGEYDDLYKGQSVVVETNNPNPLKDLHIGHAYNSIIADTIANLLYQGGADLHRVSYHGDVGLHVGKSMWAILRFIGNAPQKLDGVPSSDRPRFLSEQYALGAKAYDEDEEAKQAIEKLTEQSFKLDDPIFRTVYETCKEWSFDYFDGILAGLGNQPVEKRYLESQTDNAGRAIVESHTGKVFEKVESGAVIFKGEDYGLHTRVFISGRGTTLYEARDLGLMELKQTDFMPAKSFIVTANEQRDYFKVVLKAAELCLPDLKDVTVNISTGLVKLSSGKMNSRGGQAVPVTWLMMELQKALQKRGADEEGLEDSVIGAIRYTMLKNRIGNDVVFDTGEAISLEGNSGPYLQYAHARARSILMKAETPAKLTEGLSLEAGERELLGKISQFSEVLMLALSELMPHHICTYLYELAQSFNRFYEHNRVIGNPRQAVRLHLVERYADTLKEGLSILSIPSPDKM